MPSRLSELIEYVSSQSTSFVVPEREMRVGVTQMLELEGDAAREAEAHGVPVPCEISSTAAKDLCRLHSIPWGYMRKASSALFAMNANWWLSSSDKQVTLTFTEGVLSEVTPLEGTRSVAYVLKLVADAFAPLDPVVVQPDIQPDHVSLVAYDPDRVYETDDARLPQDMNIGVVVEAPTVCSKPIVASPAFVDARTETAIAMRVADGLDKEMELDDHYVMHEGLRLSGELVHVADRADEDYPGAIDITHFFKYDAPLCGVKGVLNSKAYETAVLNDDTPTGLAASIMVTQEAVKSMANCYKLMHLAGRALAPSVPLVCQACHSVVRDDTDDERWAAEHPHGVA